MNIALMKLKMNIMPMEVIPAVYFLISYMYNNMVYVCVTLAQLNQGSESGML